MLRRFRKWSWLVLSLALLAGVVLRSAAQHFAKVEIARQMTELLGGEVTIESVALGFRWQQVQGLQLCETDVERPWMTVDRLDCELAVTDVVRGLFMPREVVMSGLRINLLLDESGQVIRPQFQLPSKKMALPVSRLYVKDGVVQTQLHDGTTFSLAAIDARLYGTATGIFMKGRCGESPLGAIELVTDLHAAAKEIRGTATVKPFQFDSRDVPEPLRSRFSSQIEQFRQVGSWHGMADGEVVFRWSLDHRPVYRAEFHLSSSHLRVIRQGLDVENLSGQVVVENGIVSLEDMRGSFCSGQIAAKGTVALQTGGTGQLSGEIRNALFPFHDELSQLLPDVTAIASADFKLDLAHHESSGWTATGQGHGRLEQTQWQGMSIDTVIASVELQQARIAAERGQYSEMVSSIAGQLVLNVGVVDAPVAQWLDCLMDEGRDLSSKVDGTVSARLDITIPLQSLLDPSRYEAIAKINSPGLMIAQTPWGPFDLEAELHDGSIFIDETVVPTGASGQVKLGGAIALFSEGDSQLQCALQDVPMELFHPYAPQLAPLHGLLHGTIGCRIPESNWQKTSAWQLEGSVAAASLQWQQAVVDDVLVKLVTSGSAVELQTIRARWQGLVLEGQGRVETNAPYSFEVQVSSARTDLAPFFESSQETQNIIVAGTAAGDAQLIGALDPLDWSGAATVRGEGVKVNDFSLGQVTLPWKIDTRRLELQDTSLAIFGGSVHLSGVIPLDGLEASHLEGQLDSCQLSELSQFLGASSSLRSGAVSGSISIQNLPSFDHLSAELQVEQVEAIVRDLELNEGRGSIRVAEGIAKIQLDGQTLGGQCSLAGQARIGPPHWQPTQVTGKVTLQQVQLQQLWSQLGRQQQFGSLRALCNAEFRVELDQLDSTPVARGQIDLSQISWNGVLLSREASADVNLAENELRVEEMHLRIDRSEIVGGMRIGLPDGRGDFQIGFDDVPLRALTVFTPQLTRGTYGSVRGDFTGTLGERWDCTGVLQVQRGNIANIPLSAIRMPIHFQHAPAAGRTSLKLEILSGRIASGRAKGQLHMHWSGRMAMKGSAELHSADLLPLARALPGVSDLLQGRITAKVNLESVNLRHANDLAGKYNVRLTQSQTLLLPGLNRLTTAIGVASPSEVTFTESKFEGKIGRGNVHVDTMEMKGAQARLWADGHVDLNGRMSFNVVADTGQLSAINLVAATINPIALLRRRLVFVHLEGSLRDPVVQLRADQFLAQEAILFFLPVISLR